MDRKTACVENYAKTVNRYSSVAKGSFILSSSLQFFGLKCSEIGHSACVTLWLVSSLTLELVHSWWWSTTGSWHCWFSKYENSRLGQNYIGRSIEQLSSDKHSDLSLSSFNCSQRDVFLFDRVEAILFKYHYNNSDFVTPWTGWAL